MVFLILHQFGESVCFTEIRFCWYNNYSWLLLGVHLLIPREEAFPCLASVDPELVKVVLIRTLEDISCACWLAPRWCLWVRAWLGLQVVVPCTWYQNSNCYSEIILEGGLLFTLIVSMGEIDFN